MRRLVVLAAALLSFVSFAQSAVIVGVVASTSDETAKKQADAFASFVGRAVKEQALSKIYADQEALAQALAKNEIDVALLGPLGYLRLDPKLKPQLLFRVVRHGKATYRSVLFAPANTKYPTVEALKKAKTPLKVAWVETSSATGYVIAKASLIEQGINPVQAFETQDFLGSHDAVCKAVLEGKYDFGATFSDPVLNAAKVTGCVGPLGRKADSLKVVLTSSEVPNDVVVASPKFSAGKAQAITAAAKEAGASADGKKTLEAAFLAEGVADVKDDDFKPVRKALEAFVP
ncbi:MAG TPA: PhnD/SsuA/transferrin family substrate-binding protein [Archangium sp.]